MDFTLSLEQQMIRDAAINVLATHSDSAAVRRIIESVSAGSGYDPALWLRLGSELGWCGLMLPEDVGGSGLGTVEMVIVMEQLGRHLACVPYLSSACLAASALRHCLGAPAANPWLERLARGEVQASLAVSHNVFPAPNACCSGDRIPSISAQCDGNDFLLYGQVAQVFGATHSDWLLLIAGVTTGSGIEPALFLIDQTLSAGDARLKVRRLPTLDLTRPVAAVEFDAFRATSEQRLATGDAVAAGLERALWITGLAVAAEQLGGAQRCLDMTVTYTKERVQFGRPIASFQAVKHRCAQMMVGIEALRSMVYGAAYALDTLLRSPPAANAPADIWLDIAAARAMANEVYAFCAQEAIQLHGGLGFTWEHDPQLHLKRARASALWFGSTPETLESMAATLLDRA